MDALDQLLYALAWLSFGVLHSLLAHPPVQRALGHLFGSATRLAYNIFATLHLLAVWLIGQWLGAAAAPLPLPAWSVWLQGLMLAGGGLVALVALRAYDLGRFAGTWQLRGGRAPGHPDENEGLVTGGLHRYLRHPLYSALLLIIWGLARDELSLATAGWITAYLLVGSWLEERKLIGLYGDAYRRYRQRVPAFLPWRGRAI